MKRFKKILCYMGGSVDGTPGLERAVALAERNRAQLTLIDVLAESTEGPWLTLPGQPELEKALVLARQEELAEMAASIEERGIQVRTEVVVGSAFLEICRVVEKEGYDLVIKTAQGVGTRLGGLLGSTAHHLLRKCPSPVWAVKPPMKPATGRIVAAVDADSEKAGGVELSVKVLEVASSLARLRSCHLDIVHAWWLYSEAMLRGSRIRMPAAKVDGIVREVRLASEQNLDRILSNVDLSELPHKIHLVKGQPDEVISEFASIADDIVLGTVSRSGIEGLFIGNTAERVLGRIDCSVLAVKPAGFRSPLRF